MAERTFVPVSGNWIMGRQRRLTLPQSYRCNINIVNQYGTIGGFDDSEEGKKKLTTRDK